MSNNKSPNVGLFVTCLANVIRPLVAEATLQLLEEAGCKVDVPLEQSCCGQIGYNAGDMSGAAPIAKKMIETFEGYDYVVAPSGSCVGMITHHYPSLFEEGSEWRKRAEALVPKVYEITSFLVDVLNVDLDRKVDLGDRVITYHDSCAGLREMGIKEQPRALLKARTGAEVTEMANTNVCCGFGGTFCAKQPEISLAMADEKLANAKAVGATTLVGGDLGCLMNLGGRAQFQGKTLEVRHIVELLTGKLDVPALGQEVK